jgi:hypothetical protein
MLKRAIEQVSSQLCQEVFNRSATFAPRVPKQARIKRARASSHRGTLSRIGLFAIILSLGLVHQRPCGPSAQFRRVIRKK